VSRISGANGAVSVAYATGSGTASAGTDYTAASGTVTWADSDTTPKTIQVALGNAAAFSGIRTFTLALSSPTGGTTLGSPATATISIAGTLDPAAAMGTNAAARLLMQGTFGATPRDITNVAGQSYSSWLSAQAAASPSLELPRVANWNDDRLPAWWYNAIKGPDQLRLRMAFALSQILVISSDHSVLYSTGQARAYYYDLLTTNALGNFRTLLDLVSHSPEMGIYLSFLRNDKPNPTTGVHADENYAREVMQLFTIGLWKLNPDGSQQLDGNGQPIPTYSQADVTNLARVFTGWSSAPISGQTGENAWLYLGQGNADFFHPMVCYSAHHDTDPKTIVGGVAIPAGGTCDSDTKVALDTLFSHPNVGPFIGKQLIQRFVTSNPSPGYVSRVAAVFADNGQGVRGDLFAVIKAILTDPEAITAGPGPGAGKLREPVVRLTNLWRAFSASDANGLVAAQITGWATEHFGQNSLSSPTVFNFYRPDYQRAGPLTNAGLVAPEFQITNENTIVVLSNDLQQQAYAFVDSTSHSHVGMDYAIAPSTSDVLLHTAAWEPLAADAATLIDNLNLVFMAGQMPGTMRTTLINYVNGIPASSTASRVIEAAQLLINSPQYAVQR
jgi:uncharacterized protein (DUF1800 family)